MKKTKSKSQNKSQKSARQQAMKRTAYIGIFTFVFVGLFGFFALRNISDLTLRDNPTVVIPTSPPLLPALAEPSAPLPKSTEPPKATVSPAEEAVSAPVFTQSEPFTLILPLEGEVLLPFSNDKLVFSKTMGDWRTHLGIDLAADSGTAVKAAADGIVEKAYQDPLMGYTIVLSHSDSYRTIYQNLASLEMVTLHQEVKQGQAIAAVGNSAGAEMLEKSHLHFALTENEQFCNPSDFLSS